MDKRLEAATLIASNRRSRGRLSALPEALCPQGLPEAYDVQDALHELLAPELGRVVGYKIGCTSPVMQRYLSIPHPCAGALYAHSVYASSVRLPASQFVQVGVECEFAVTMGAALPPSSQPYAVDAVAQAIATWHAAIEIVDDRYARWESLGAPTLIADDFFSAGLVLGPPVPRARAPELHAVVGRAFINGKEASRGTGADVLGHPHIALTWLANHLAARGQGLREGDVVTVGSVVKTIWIGRGDNATMEFDGLGVVSLALD